MSVGSVVNYIPAINIPLFLAIHDEDVKETLKAKLPAGRISQTDVYDYYTVELRVAFDSDGVFASDEAKKEHSSVEIETEKKHKDNEYE